MSELKLPQEILTCRVSAIDLANMLMIQEATGLNRSSATRYALAFTARTVARSSAPQTSLRPDTRNKCGRVRADEQAQS